MKVKKKMPGIAIYKFQLYYSPVNAKCMRKLIREIAHLLISH